MRRIGGRRPVALAYHGFHTDPVTDPYDLHVHRDAFAAQLALLRRNRWQALDLDGFVRASEAGHGRRRFLVTVDDGLVSFADLAAPVLARAQVPAVLFVPAGLLGDTTRWLDQTPEVPILDVDQLRALYEGGVEIGGHGWTHEHLMSASNAVLRRATREAREHLGDLLGAAPRAFAYPFGEHDARVRRAVEQAGYTLGFTLYDDAGPLARNRVDVKPADTLPTLRTKLIPGYRLAWRTAGYLGPVRGLARRAAQRLGRPA